MRNGLVIIPKRSNMAYYKVLAGMHIQADKSQESTVVKDANGNTTEKYPSATYKTGDVFESDVDMVAKHGAEKYQLVGGKPEPYEPPLSNPAKFPGGQVSSGVQGGEAAEAKQRAIDAGERSEKSLSPPSGAKTKPERQLSPHEKAEQDKARAELNKKSYPELVEMAKHEKVDLKGATSKAQVIDAILNAD